MHGCRMHGCLWWPARSLAYARPRHAAPRRAAAFLIRRVDASPRLAHAGICTATRSRRFPRTPSTGCRRFNTCAYGGASPRHAALASGAFFRARMHPAARTTRARAYIARSSVLLLLLLPLLLLHIRMHPGMHAPALAGRSGEPSSYRVATLHRIGMGERAHARRRCSAAASERACMRAQRLLDRARLAFSLSLARA